MIEDAITRGTWCGICLGTYEALERLPLEADQFLARRSYCGNLSPKDQGIRNALVKLNLIKRRWLFWFEVTAKGVDYLAKRGR